MKSKNISNSATEDILRQLAFDHSIQPNIIAVVDSGKIVMANTAACRLFGYSKKELLTKRRADIFDIKEIGFKEMLRQRVASGQSKAMVTAIKKSGKRLPCEITTAVFLDENGIENSITTITDMSESVLNQMNIDIGKEKIVADNIEIAKSKQKEIDTKRKNIVSANLSAARSEQKEADLKKEKIVAHDIAIARVKQKRIDNKKEKIVADNIVLALVKSDAKLAQNNAWIEYIAKASYDVMWDWDILTGKIYVGNSINEVFGYKVQTNSVNVVDFTKSLLPGEKKIFESKLSKVLGSKSKIWNASFKLRRHDGTIASTTSRASIVRDKGGRAIRLIGAIQDVSKLRELEKELKDQISLKKESNDVFQVAAKLSYDGIWDWNMLTGEFFLGEGFKELFGYSNGERTGNMADWSSHLHPDDKEAVELGLSAAIASSASHWEHSYRFIRADGSIADVFGRASIIRDNDGKACRMIGVIHDISKQKALEEKLEDEMMSKERQIKQAREEAKESERSEIGKELHDNVNQLLGASKLYIDMAKEDGADREIFLSRSSDYTITAIEEIRKLTKGLTTDIVNNVGLCESIENIAHDTMEMSSIKISCTLNSFREDSASDKFKLNVFRIVQEQLNNIIKHAHATKTRIKILQTKKWITLDISDNGVGFNTDKRRKGIGVQNIKNRAESFNGAADFISQAGKGCVLTVTFPVKDALLDQAR